MMISVIIPTYRRYKEVCATVQSLVCCEYEDFEIIVVDQNTSWPGKSARLKAEIESDPRVKWLSIGQPGVVNARHMAVEHSSGDLLLFVDDDVEIVDRNFLKHHAENYTDQGVDAVCGRELTGREGLPEPGREGDMPLDLRRLPPLEQVLRFPRGSRCRSEVTTFCTCNSSVRRFAFLSVGGFDESFRGASYGDDYDFAIRLAEAGGRIVFDPKCALVHLRAPQGGLRFADTGNAFNDYERSLSGLIFTFRYGKQFKLFWYLLYHWVLRRTLFLKRNVLKPWRQPLVVWGLVRAWREARRTVAGGPRSRFMQRVSLGRGPDGAASQADMTGRRSERRADVGRGLGPGGSQA